MVAAPNDAQVMSKMKWNWYSMKKWMRMKKQPEKTKKKRKMKRKKNQNQSHWLVDSENLPCQADQLLQVKPL